jgi:hypothetical protein
MIGYGALLLSRQTMNYRAPNPSYVHGKIILHFAFFKFYYDLIFDFL